MDSGNLTRRHCLVLALYAGFGPAMLTHAPKGFGEDHGPGLTSWLAARLLPPGEATDLELLSRVVTSHVAADGEVARVDAALRNGLTSDPYKYTSPDSFDGALAPLLRDFLERSLYLQGAVGLPRQFKLEAPCSLSPVKLDQVRAVGNRR